MMLHRRSARHRKSTNLQRSTPDLRVDKQNDKASGRSSSWRTHSAIVPGSSDARGKGPSPNSLSPAEGNRSPSPRPASPHHNRSQSHRSAKRQVRCEDPGTDSHSAVVQGSSDARGKGPSPNSLTPSEGRRSPSPGRSPRPVSPHHNRSPSYRTAQSSGTNSHSSIIQGSSDARGKGPSPNTLTPSEGHRSPSPGRRSASPHHNRSQSYRPAKRQVRCEDSGIDSLSPAEDHSSCSPGRCPRPVSPHHNRSQSYRTMRRPTPQQIQCEDSGCLGMSAGMRPRGSTMPSDSASYYLARRRMRSKNRYDHTNSLTPSPPIHEPGDDEDDEYYLLRSFSVNSKGAIVSRSDFLRQRTRSTTSVTSTTSSATPGNTSCSSGGQSRGPASKVQILGAADVGKTMLVDQFMTSEYMNSYDTQDEDMEKSVSILLDGVEYELLLMDEPMRRNYSVLDAVDDQADAYVVTYAITDRATFEKAVDVLFSLRERGATTSKAVILVGNKSDLVRSREVAMEEGKSIAYSYECKFIETSAAINHNVDELLVGVVTQIRLKNKQKEEKEEKQEKQNKKQQSKKTKSSPSPSKPSKGFSSPRRKNGGSLKGTLRSSLKTKGLINRLLGKGGRSKSCDNLQVL